MSKLVVAEINVLGSRCGTFAPAFEILRQDTVDVETTIAGEFSLAEGIVAIKQASRPGVRKILLYP